MDPLGVGGRRKAMGHAEMDFGFSCAVCEAHSPGSTEEH